MITHAVIWIHGLGDTGRGWSFLSQQLRFPAPANVHYEFPTADEQRVTCNGNSKSTSWFDINDIPVTATENDNPAGIDASLSRIHALIDSVIEKHSITADKVVLGGFSQGGAMSLLAGSTYKAPLGAVLCLSGWLLRADLNVKNWSAGQARTPVFIGHGMDDNVVVTELGKTAAERIKEARQACGDGGGVVELKLYPDTGHGAAEEELVDVQQFLNKVIK